MNYNPYTLVDLLINGKPIHGRPTAFDSEMANQKTMRNAFGNIVKPTKVATICPDCGQGLEFSISLQGDPPFKPVEYACLSCKPAIPPLVNPFVNPVETGRVAPIDLDPLLHDPNKPVNDEGNAAERFVIPDGSSPLVSAPTSEPTTTPSKKSKKQKKTKEKEPKPSPPVVKERLVPLEPADGLGEEVDFDDSELLDE